MKRFLMKKLFYAAGCLSLYGFAPFMVVASTFGGSRSLYGSVYTVRGYVEGLYYPTWMAA
jgi:hypothetical protein